MATLAAPGVSATARSRTDVTDHDLVEAVRAGDDHAFERLYERYRRRIFAYVVGMVRDHGRAEDLTQEIFVSALRRMRQTDRQIHFKPWIYEIAKNACIDAFRRSRRAEEVSFDAEAGSSEDEASRLATPIGAPDAALAAKQRLDHLWGAFDGLSEAHHQILVMREIEGLSYAEIGERLGLSRASVESTLFRARRRLSEEFAELESGEACRRAQGLVDSARATVLGRRDQRRLERHIARCAGCRRDAVLAGLAAASAASPARRPVRARLGALLPLPLLLRRRWLGGQDGAGGAGQHVASWSAAAAGAGDAPAGIMKLVAAAAAVALAGVGAGTAVTGQHGTMPAAAQAVHAPVTAPHAGGGPRHAGSTAAAPTSGRAPGRRAHAARPHHHRAAAGRRRSAGGDRTSGAERTPGRGGGQSAPASGGAGSTPEPTRATAPARDSRTTATTKPASTTSSSPEPSPALVDALTQAVSQPAPTTAGGAVQQTTEAVGGAVDGPVGQAVEDTGAALGSTVDGVTTTAGDTVQHTVGAVGSTVQQVADGATRTVDQTTREAGTTVGGVTGAVGDVVGGALGGR
ncbi:MAG TPA: sigma-70 family RNA polymerase sigma factor [Baekduia sp.]|nr:sigma-70 family RNA polymerase sigma factor [Baekduia sp.]